MALPAEMFDLRLLGRNLETKVQSLREGSFSSFDQQLAAAEK